MSKSTESDLGVGINVQEVAALLTLQKGLRAVIAQLIHKYMDPLKLTARTFDDIERDVDDAVVGILKGLRARRGRHEKRPATQFKKYVSAEGAEVHHS